MPDVACLKTQCRPLLIASLIGACLLAGCASPFERFYKPAHSYGTEVAAPSHATPLLLRTQNPDRDSKELEEKGFVLIGTSRFYSGDDPWFAYEALAQGKKLGAAVVLLRVDSGTLRGESPSDSSERARKSRFGEYVVGQYGDLPGALDYSGIFFASYWAMSDPENNSAVN